MSAFSGPQGKGARKRHKDAKRREVAERSHHDEPWARKLPHAYIPGDNARDDYCRAVHPEWDRDPGEPWCGWPEAEHESNAAPCRVTPNA